MIGWRRVEEAFLGLLVQCQDIVKQDIRHVMQWLQRMDVRMEACRTEYHQTLQCAPSSPPPHCCIGKYCPVKLDANAAICIVHVQSASPISLMPLRLC